VRSLGKTSGLQIENYHYAKRESLGDHGSPSVERSWRSSGEIATAAMPGGWNFCGGDLLGGFGLYATLRAFEGKFYEWGPYLSPSIPR